MQGSFRPTPILSAHARERCREMGIGTKRAKRMASDPDMSYTSDGATVTTRDDDPDIATIVALDLVKGSPFIMSVVWREQEEYQRNGTGYVLSRTGEGEA